MPTPVPPPINYDTVEYRQGRGLTSISALTAYEKGATGQGITVGIIDSGIDISSAEFAGRIHSGSLNVNGGSFQDPDGHGTFVASFIGAAKNGIGAHGVAYNSTLFIARTDDGTSCGTTEGCNHNDNDIAAGVNAAVASGARVLNLSLGGSAANATLRSAISNATSRGVIIVFSAGNDGTVSPDPFPTSLFTAGIDRGLIVIAGATDLSGVISTFSDRAGAGRPRDFYITAPGQDLWATGIDGRNYIVRGTSFAAPHVAGALALLLQAFPTLSSAQAVQLLLNSATDTEAPGIDDVTGHGFLNIAKAFQPQGGASVSLGQSGTRVSASEVAAVLSSGFGDAGKLGAALKDVVFLDGYGRPFQGDFSGQISKVLPTLGLRDMLRTWQQSQAASFDKNGISVGITATRNGFARPEYQTALSQNAHQQNPFNDVRAHAVMALGADTALHIAQGLDAIDIIKPISARGQFVTSASMGIDSRPLLGFGLAQGSGNLRWRAGGVRSRLSSRTADRAATLSSAAIGVDYHGQRTAFGLTLTAQNERGALLGSFAGAGFGFGKGSRSMSAESSASWQLSPRLHVMATAALGRLWAVRGADSLVENLSGLMTSAAAVSADYTGLFASHDLFALRVAQPLRLESGNAQLRLPTGYDYAARNLVYDRRSVSLTPSAREISLEASYGIALPDVGDVQVNLFQRFNPGHRADLGNDTGVVLRWRATF